ncbi:MAG: glycosyltransferase [Methylotenera sp.]|nr:glycosyltransferase [Methylotenera sp.]
MAKRIFIHATNVHQGGGRALLVAIINAIPTGLLSILSLDSRMPLSTDKVVKRVQPTLVQRLFAEIWLAKNVALGDVTLCFGNLPPLFKLRGYVVVFVQNRYLIDSVNLDGFSFKTRIRLKIERLWLSYRAGNVNEFLVQTPSMQSLMQARTKAKVSVFPFVENIDGYVRKLHCSDTMEKKDFFFLYVASGEPHKNHMQLIEAWCLLATEGLFPTLTLTLNNMHFAELCFWIESKIESHKICVKNLGSLPHSGVKELYSQVDALIYPSTFESFGLPLIEARQAGLPIIASELDYVRDVLDPEESFDPGSSISIARAVKRFMGVDEASLPLQDASRLVEYLLKKVE